MKHWITAMRLRTLPLALSCIAMGSAVAWSQGRLSPIVWALASFTAIGLQILSNLANDYGDTIHGADGPLRTGPTRAVQEGTISSASMLRAIVLAAAISLISGMVLLLVAPIGWTARMVLLLLGLASIAAAYFYTNGTRPYGYMGLGDLSVGLFFGLLGVCGSYYLHTGTWADAPWWLAISIGAFAIGVLNLNNIRDIVSDRAAGKISLAVRMGSRGARIYHTALIILAWAGALIYALQHDFRAVDYLFAAVAIIHIFHLHRVWSADKIDPELKVLALSTVLFTILYSVGMMRWITL